MAPLLTPPSVYSHDGVLQLNKFFYVSGTDQFVYAADVTLWTATAINGRFPPVKTTKKVNGKYVYLKPADWLRAYRAVEQQTWMPSDPEIIADRLLTGGGWRSEPGVHVFNLYKPPDTIPGDATQATPWIEHLNLLYPEDAEDITNWFAHRVQFPGVKINHALGLGGAQGIGKDTLLEPIKEAVGPENFHEISPVNLMDTYNPFVRTVILRMSEAHDLGDGGRIDRFALYERIKAYAAAPPNVLACVDKYIRRFYVPNVLGLIITTNHKTDGVYLPADDRRHFMAWSDCAKEQFASEYFTELWRWFQQGGYGHVTAYLLRRDLSRFDPCAVPRQTTAFYEIVNAGQAPEDAEIADALDELGRPDACTLSLLAATKCGATLEWLLDRRRRRSIPHRLERSGYIAQRNFDTKDGLWVIDGRRQTVCVKAALPRQQQRQAAFALMAQQTKVAGNG
jgi:hypothetical protein